MKYMPQTVRSIGSGAVAVFAAFAIQPVAAEELVAKEVLGAHDYSLADSPNKRTALAYLYTAWNDSRLEEARKAYGAPGAFVEAGPDMPPPGMMPSSRPPRIRFTIKKVIEEGDHVVVLAFVEGIGIGKPITTLFGTPGDTKIGDAVVEIFQFAPDGRIARKWDTIEPLTEKSYDFR